MDDWEIRAIIAWAVDAVTVGLFFFCLRMNRKNHAAIVKLYRESEENLRRELADERRKHHS